MNIRPTTLLLMLAVGLAACGGGGGGNAEPDESNNSPPTTQVESDPVIFSSGIWRLTISEKGDLGSGRFTEQNTPIIVNVDPTTIGQFTVGNAYFSRAWGNSDKYVIPIKNNGKETCFIEAGNISFIDMAGTPLTITSLNITGSTYYSNNTLTNTCLASGETGFLLGENLGYYPWDISQINISTITGLSPDNIPAKRQWLPIRIDSQFSLFNFQITLQNISQNYQSLPLVGNKFIFFNSQNEPVLWGKYLYGENSSTAPNNTSTFEGSYAGFDGKINRVEIFYSID